MTARFALAFTLLSVVILAALEVPLGVNYADQRRTDLITQLQRDALSIGDVVEDVLEAQASNGATASIAAEAYAGRTGARVVIVDEDGSVLADSTPPDAVGDGEGRDFTSRPEIADALAGRSSSGERFSATLDEDLLYVAEPVRSGERVLGAVRITRTAADLDDDVADYWRTLGVIAAITLVTAAVIGWLLGRWVNQPLADVIATARDVGGGDLDARARTDHGPPEIRDLAAQVNTTTERLGAALQSSQELAADAAHQLRTPLTALRLRIDNLTARSEPVTDDDLAPLFDELERLDHTIDVLLALSRLDRAPPSDATADAAAIGRDRIELWRYAAEDAGVTIVDDLGAALPVRCDPNHLEQVLDNLLANAVAASPAASTIDVRLRRSAENPDTVALHVIDHGAGMSAAARARATERHWHRSESGHGLGLAIVTRLCEHNRATLRLDETPGGGLDAVVVLRAAPSGGAA